MPDALPPPIKEMNEFEQRIWQSFQAFWNNADELDNGWTVDFSKAKLRLEYATEGPPPRVSYLLNVRPEMINRMGNLHGGCSATLVDILTSTLLVGIGKPGMFSYGGVSRGLRVTYLRPVPVDTEIRIICEAVQIGRRMALTKAEIFRAEDGVLCVVGEHEKANTDPDMMKV